MFGEIALIINQFRGIYAVFFRLSKQFWMLQLTQVTKEQASGETFIFVAVVPLNSAYCDVVDA